MKRIIHKTIDVIPMSRQEAEDHLKIKINNPCHGDMGYLVGQQWVPAHVVDENSTAFETDDDKMTYFVTAVKEALDFVDSKDIRRLRNKVTLRHIANKLFIHLQL